MGATTEKYEHDFLSCPQPCAEGARAWAELAQQRHPDGLAEAFCVRSGVIDWSTGTPPRLAYGLRSPGSLGSASGYLVRVRYQFRAPCGDGGEQRRDDQLESRRDLGALHLVLEVYPER